MFLNDDATPDDHLNRARIARGFAGLIINAPENSSFRLGIYGGWGEGKTSIMRMMQDRIVAAGHRAVFLVPWNADSQQELTARILTAIADELGVTEATQAAVTEKISSTLSSAWGKVADIDWKLKLVDKVVGGVIESAADRVRKWQGKRVLDAIAAALQTQRLVVFIDDVDRAKPALIPDMLLNIREALDLPNLFYVVGLSPVVVQEGLTQIHSGWSEPLRFLEKIVEYSVFLPPPTPAERRSYVRVLANAAAGTLDQDTLDSLGGLLPTNPRVLKLFVRHLINVSAQLSRFDRTEISLPALYLCHLLLIEFPLETRTLLRNPQDIDWLEHYHMHRAKREEDAGERSPHTAAMIADAPRRERFVTLCVALGERLPLVSQYPLPELALLLERPPIITWKEFGELFDRQSAADVDSRRMLISDWIAEEPMESESRSRALFGRAVEYRRRAWGHLIDLETHDEMVEMAANICRLNAFIRLLMDDMRMVETGIVTADDWWTLYEQFKDASRFQRPADIYRSIQADDRNLLRDSIQKMPLPTGEAVLIKMSAWAPEISKPAESFQRLVSELSKELARSIADRLLRRFEEPDGVDVLWGDSSPAEKVIAFDLASPFYQRQRRVKWQAIASRASVDEGVQKNFLTFFRMIGYGAMSGGSFDRKACIELIKSRTVMKTVWRAATVKRLNWRTVGSLHEQRTAVLSLGANERDLTVPRWWKQLEKQRPTTTNEGAAEGAEPRARARRGLSRSSTRAR